jgi:uncharacterized membrane protein YdjX (TVP38/TMEM64 family)
MSKNMAFVKKPAVQAGFLLSFVTVALAVVYLFGVQQFTPDTIQNWVVSFGWWGPVVYVILYTLRPLLFFPALIFTLAGGLAFGPWWGTFYVILGASLGAYLCFGVSRLLGQQRCRALWTKSLSLQTWNENSATSGFRTILMMRVVPLFPYDLVSYGAGLSKIKFADYATATTLGMIPGAFAYNLLGYSLHDIFSPTFGVAVTMVVIVFFSPLIYQHLRKKNFVKKKVL